MKILAIDSSGLVASAALLEDGALIAEYTLNYKKTHSQTLLPMIDELIRMTEQPLEEIDAIAIAEGPGSFTGLRIGSATAKGLGLALDKEIIGVPTVDALAYNLFGTERLICPLMDARRSQVYTGLYSFEQERFLVVKEQDVLSIDEVIARVNEIGRPVIFLGDGVPVYRKKLETVSVAFSFAPAHLARQRAGAVGALAQIYYQEGKMQTAAEHVPVYLRLSQAERERAERLNTENGNEGKTDGKTQ